MTNTHKNKTIATLLSALLGSIGIHRFYLKGRRDQWGWLHFISLPVSLLLTSLLFNLPLLATMSPLVLSFLASLLEALMLGLKSDEAWDVLYNPKSDKKSESSWPLALILVLTLGIGAMTLIAVLARSLDLLYTGGAYG